MLIVGAFVTKVLGATLTLGVLCLLFGSKGRVAGLRVMKLDGAVVVCFG